MTRVELHAITTDGKLLSVVPESKPAQRYCEHCNSPIGDVMIEWAHHELAPKVPLDEWTHTIVSVWLEAEDEAMPRQ